MDDTGLDFKKRRLLKWSAYTLLLSTSGLLSAVSQPSVRVATRRHSEFDELWRSMQALGREYLEKYPNENSRHNLLNLLESRTGSEGYGQYGLCWEGLRKSIKDDFRIDDVVYLKGWSLARTEARLFALSVV
jgi:hypothetical protein